MTAVEPTAAAASSGAGGSTRPVAVLRPFQSRCPKAVAQAVRRAGRRPCYDQALIKDWKNQVGSSFVNVAGNGFWMNDGVLELWLRFAALHIEDSTDDHSPVHTIRNEWLLASRGYFGGAVPFNLERNISTPEGRTAVLDAATAFLEALKKAPPQLHPAVLNLLGISGRYLSEIDSSQLIEVSESLLDLIAGKKFGTASDSGFRPGSRRTAN